MKKLFILFFILLLPNIALANRYYDPNDTTTLAITPTGNPAKDWYVDGTNGNDSWNGHYATYTSGTNGPKKTIASAMYRYTDHSYGDRVMIKAGTYKELIDVSLSLSGTGSEDNRFIVGPYGDGEVIIDRSTPVTWSVYSGNVYQATWIATTTAWATGTAYAIGNYVTCGAECGTAYNGNTYLCAKVHTSGTFATDYGNGRFKDYTVNSIVMDDNYRSCRPKTSIADLTSDGLYFQDNSVAGVSTLYLCSTTGTPSSRSAMVRQYDPNSTIYGVYVTEKNYVSIYGLTILNTPSIGIAFYNASYGVVEQCKVKYSGKNGIVLSSGTSSYGKAIKNDIHANCMQNWPRGRDGGSTGGWDTGISMGNYGNASGNIVGKTGGEGINIYGAGTGAIMIEDNIVYDSYSVNIYPDSHPYVTVRNNFIYSSGIDTTDIVDTPPGGSSVTTISRKLRGEGIMLGDETAAGGGSHDQKVYNNLILACREGINGYHQATGSGWINDYIYNNVIILPNYDPTAIADNFWGIDVETNANNSGTFVKNNIIIGQEAHGRVAYKGTDSGSTWDYNIYYHPNNATPLRYNATNYNFTDWKTNSGQDANSKNQDPLLVNSDWSAYD